MLIYFIMLGLSLFFAVYAQRAKPYIERNASIRKSYVAFCVLAALPFVFVTVFRYRVGKDWVYIYETGYAAVQHGVETIPDPGFRLIFRLFGLITAEPYWAIAFVGLLTMIFFFAAFCRQSVMLPLTILLFFVSGAYFGSLNAIRQALAMSMFLFSVPCLKARDWKRYFLINLIGAALHQSSIIYLPIYFLYGIRATPRRCLTVLLISIAAYPALAILIRMAGQFLPRVSRYYGDVFDTQEFNISSLFVSMVVLAVHMFYLARFPERDKDFEWMTWMVLLGTELLLYYPVISVFQRAAEGTNIVQVLSIPMMVRKETDDRMRVLIPAGLAAMFALQLSIVQGVGKNYGVTPFQWVFFK